MLELLSKCIRAFMGIFVGGAEVPLSSRLLSAVREFDQQVMASDNKFVESHAVHVRGGSDCVVVFDGGNRPLCSFIIPTRAVSPSHVLKRLYGISKSLTVSERYCLSFGYYTERGGKITGCYTSDSHHLMIGDSAILDKCPLFNRMNVVVTRESTKVFSVRFLNIGCPPFAFLSSMAKRILTSGRLAGGRKIATAFCVLGDKSVVNIKCR